MTVPIRVTVVLLGAMLCMGVPAFAGAGQQPANPPGQTSAGQSPPADPSAQQQPAAPPAADQEEDDDLSVDPLEPDFTLITLPTNFRMPNHKSAFRVTHRFTRPLGQGDFSDLVSDLFGLDSGAGVGLEYRFGLMPGTQVGIHRSNFDKTYEFFAQHNFLKQAETVPVSFDVILSAEIRRTDRRGTNDFGHEASPALGFILSRRFARAVAFYVEPVWVGNTRNQTEAGSDDSTLFIGLGTRIRVRRTVYLVGEFSPRVAGHDPGCNHGAFALEKRVGGHIFQINVSNSLGTTMGQIAHGIGNLRNDWYLGFNISRKFF
ncbi:MAG: hypothetical protein HYX76_02625 [Acidobacteria bacterium]|nr:hypothetical protein [Acidobacteriota bacterium]